MPPHDRTWLPIGLTAVVTLFINIAVLSTASMPATAASVPTSTESVRAVAADQIVIAHAAHVTDRSQKPSGASPADAPTDLPAVEATVPPGTGYRANGTFELAAISTAGLAARQRLDAAAESTARAQAQRAAEQAAVELRADSPTTEPTPAPKPTPADNHHARAERATDAIPFDWKAHGITFRVGCHPDQSRCAWGTFDHRVDEVWLSSEAFASDARLRYVIAHELAHAWQWSTNLDDRRADLTDFGVPTSDGIEYGADCVAEAWGHPVSTYWDCPSDAVAHMRSVFAATT